MLPSLREEILLYAGPPAKDGAPTWLIHDAARNLFFKIDWLTFEILSRWHFNNSEEIVAAIEIETPIDASSEDVNAVVRYLDEHELIVRHSAKDSQLLANKLAMRQISFWKWLLHRYLFFRVPLWQPDKWLTSTLSIFSIFYSRWFFYLTAAVLFIGLVEISQQWQTFVATLVDTYSWQGVAGYLITIVVVKFLHELGHAYTAKRYGCRVPTMGVAFLVFFPVAYTDVNEAWKLRKNSERLAVGAAGIITELVIAVWATFAWAFLPDGFLRMSAFILATTTWISTLIINASPFLRFDGYFLLMDWLDIPNLHQRAFNLSRWRLREMLFGLKEEVPEHFSRIRERALIIFGYTTWLYRLVVFGGIAFLLLQTVAKPIGHGLAAIEISYFIALPIWGELKTWRDKLPAIMHSRRSIYTLLGLIFLIVLMALPWDQRVSSQGVLKPAKQYPLNAPGASIVGDILFKNNAMVENGDVLIKLLSPDLEYQRTTAAVKVNQLGWQASATGIDSKIRQQKQVIAAAREKASAEISSIASEQDRYRIKAPFSGVFFLDNPDLQPGVWLAKNEKIGVIANLDSWQVETYLPESELERVKIGDAGYFYSETPDVAHIKLRVTHIDTDATHYLNERMLASTHGGRLLVREKGKLIVPETALYRVTLAPQTKLDNQTQILRGSIVIQGSSQSLVHQYIKSAQALLVRESVF